jgi:hypothetical protein
VEISKQMSRWNRLYSKITKMKNKQERTHSGIIDTKVKIKSTGEHSRRHIEIQRLLFYCQILKHDIL